MSCDRRCFGESGEELNDMECKSCPGRDDGPKPSAASAGSVAANSTVSCKCGGSLARISDHLDNRFRCERCRDIFRYENGSFVCIRTSN